MFEIVRLDLQRCVRVNQGGFKGALGAQISRGAGSPDAHRPQSSAAAAWVKGSRLATF